jgi:hypothetical protein
MKAWITIWTSPRITIQNLANTDAEEGGLFVAALAGFLYGYKAFTLGKPLLEPGLLVLRKFWLAVAITSAFAGIVANLAFRHLGASSSVTVSPHTGSFTFSGKYRPTKPAPNRR